MADYVQEMAAAVCASGSGGLRVAPTRLTNREARDDLARLRESGEDRERAGGRLAVVDGGTCRAHAGADGPRARLAAIEELPGR